MTTLSESRILGALTKATGVGLVEERFTVGGCEVVMRNLRPDEYDAITAEIKDLTDAAYLYAFQLGHVCRSIVEIGGVDLRAVEYIQAEIPDPTPEDPERVKKVLLERHDWLATKVLMTWSREALSTCYRKFADVLTIAEERASAGITFVVPDETNEDKFKRLLNEAIAATEDLPEELVLRMFEQVGFVKKSTAAERQVAEEKLSKLKADTEVKPEPSPAPEPPQKAPDVSSQPTPQELMRRRQPLNQAAAQMPAPPIPQAPVVVEPTVLKGRAAELAAIETQAMEDSRLQAGLPPKPRPEDIPVLSREATAVDPKGVIGLLDQPPVAGVNSRFRPPTR
jgi:hypothetical protein